MKHSAVVVVWVLVLAHAGSHFTHTHTDTPRHKNATSKSQKTGKLPSEQMKSEVRTGEHQQQTKQKINEVVTRCIFISWLVLVSFLMNPRGKSDGKKWTCTPPIFGLPIDGTSLCRLLVCRTSKVFLFLFHNQPQPPSCHRIANQKLLSCLWKMNKLAAAPFPTIRWTASSEVSFHAKCIFIYCMARLVQRVRANALVGSR